MTWLLDPDILNLLFALAGGLLGWWARQRSIAGQPVPEAMQALLQLLNDRKREQNVHSLLGELQDAIREKRGTTTP